MTNKYDKKLNIWIKDFDEWNGVKKTLDKRAARPKGYKEREIWWAAVGTNIGEETDGKGITYSRPILILSALNKKLCFVAFLSTTARRGEYFYELKTPLNTGKKSVVLLNQLRTLDTARLHESSAKLGIISMNEYNEIRERIIKYVLYKNSPQPFWVGAHPEGKSLII